MQKTADDCPDFALASLAILQSSMHYDTSFQMQVWPLTVAFSSRQKFTDRHLSMNAPVHGCAIQHVSLIAMICALCMEARL